MIDLTPLEVRKKKGDFRRVLRGYEPAQVDDFLDLAADRLEELVREHRALAERVARLDEQVRDYRDRERALTEALVTAQEMREEVRQQTTREAEVARREAEAESVSIRQAAMQAREREEDAVRRLQARQRQLVASYRAFLDREIAELQVIAQALETEPGGTSSEPAPVPPPAPTNVRIDADEAREPAGQARISFALEDEE